ncbi:MAG: XRE family transcriptional regulator [Clostridia bacterium]|nr:XRE family transcriptional regulator [Clostridia bacterium]
MLFDSEKFKKRVHELGYTIGEVAGLIGVNEATLYRKIAGTSEFSRAEIQLLRGVLKLSATEAEAIFFANELA